jgi:iron complex outermembrane receptor protein
VKDEIIPTGTGFPQETFTNAGETTHNGVELSLAITPHRSVDVNIAYTYSDFYYRRFTNDVGVFDGNRIPGIPAHRIYGSLRYTHRSGLNGGFQTEYVDSFFANDFNTVRNDKYAVSGIYGGYARYFERLGVSGLVRVDNLFDRLYSAYVIINDRFGGFFYPSPPRNYMAMLSVSWNFNRPQRGLPSR